MNYRTTLCAAVLRIALSPPCEPVSAQVTIINPGHVEFPAGKPEVLLHTAREVAAKEFHIKNIAEIEFPLVLVLGDSPEPPAKEGTKWDAIIDENGGSLKLYMKEWDETKFAALAIRLCVQKLTNSGRQMRLVNEVLARALKLAPVSTSELQPHGSRVADKAHGAKPATTFHP